MDSKKDFTNVKILISYTEYDRLKKIESEFLELQKTELPQKQTGGNKY